MKTKLLFLTLYAVLLTLVSCTDAPNGGEKIKPGRYALSGKVEKGPFVRGSSISVQPLDESLNAIGSIFNGEIKDNSGIFDVGEVDLASQLVRITANGYYFNEVSGQLSQGTLHLVALADASNKKSINVNIITHLKAERIKRLVASGSKFADADKQAQKELLTQFGLQAFDDAVTNSNGITSGDDGAGVIIVMSSLILNNRSDAQITELLSTLSEDLADDGEFSEDNRRLISYKTGGDWSDIFAKLDKITENITTRYNDLGMEVIVPDLLLYFDLDGDGIAGNELAKDPKITLSQTEFNFGKDGGTAMITIDANFKCYTKENCPNPPLLNVIAGNEILRFSNLAISARLDNNTLIITVPKSELPYASTEKVEIYDAAGRVVASVSINIEGDPTCKPSLTGYGKSCVGVVCQKMDEMVNRYNNFEENFLLPKQEIAQFLKPNNDKIASLLYLYFEMLRYVHQISGMCYYEKADEYGRLFQTYNAILYTQMVELWGDMPLIRTKSDYDNQYPSRTESSVIRTYYIDLLKNVLDVASNENAPDTSDPLLVDKLFFLSKDIVNLALADLYLQQGLYQLAYECYDEGIKNYPMGKDILFKLYNVSDIKLRMAECKLKLGDSTMAQKIVDDVKRYHSDFASISGGTLEQIDQMHRQAKHPGYYGFLKRSGFAKTKYGFEDYQLLLPLPSRELMINPNLTQNPGY